MTKRWMYAALVLTIGLTGGGNASAQTLSRPVERTPVDKDASDDVKASQAAEARTVQSNGLLTQADVTSGPGSTQVALQAGDFFITGKPTKGYAKIYFRTTVAVSSDVASQTAGGAQAPSTPAAAADPGAAASKSALTSAATQALLDPYGGVLNLSGGYFRQLGAAHARTPKGESGEPLESEGLFLDTRFGMKLITLPNQSADSTKVGQTSVTPFVTSVLGLRYRHTLYNDGLNAPLGLIEIGLAAVSNVAADTSLSSVFADNTLSRSTMALSLSVALQVSESFAVTMTGSPMSRNGGVGAFGRNYQVGVKLLNSSK